MKETLKAVIVELSGRNIRNQHINLRGAFGLFPDNCFGGSSEAVAAKPIVLHIADEVIETDIDETKAIFRERGVVGRFFADQAVIEFQISKISKRGFNYHL